MSNYKLISKIWQFAKPFRKTLLLIFLCILAIWSIEALSTIFLSSIFDIIQLHSNNIDYLPKALFFSVLSVVGVVVKILISRYQGYVEIKKLDIVVSNQLNHNSISRYFNFSNGQHINEHSGVKQSIITSGFTSIQSQIHMFVYVFFPAIANFFTSIFMLFLVSKLIGISYIFFSVLMVFVLIKFNKYLQPKIREVRDARNETSRTVSELYRFVFLIKNEVAEKKSLSDLDDTQNTHQHTYERAWIPGNNWITIIKLSMSIFRYASIILGVWFLFLGWATAGSIFLLFTWSQNFITSLWMITDMQKQFIGDKVNIEKYFELVDVESDIKESENPITTDLIGDIEFRNVNFRYPIRKKSHTIKETCDSELVIKNLSFTISLGQKVAFVGESGSGKSTIANLIRRAFDPQSGQILFNGKNLKDIKLSNLLKMIGSVDQEVQLFDRSIRHNISFGTDELLTDSELNKIAKLSRIDSFYKKLEHGWDTIVGERGSKISGGEKQRIGIARALAKNPEILIFDEATSALDTVSERVVQSSIDVACKGKTSIIIAHRLSTVKNCDKIFVLKNGNLIAEGTHEELLLSSDYYQELVKHQLGNKQSDSNI